MKLVGIGLSLLLALTITNVGGESDTGSVDVDIANAITIEAQQTGVKVVRREGVEYCPLPSGATEQTNEEEIIIDMVSYSSY